MTTYTNGDLNLLTGISYDTTSKATGVATTSGESIWYRSAALGRHRSDSDMSSRKLVHSIGGHTNPCDFRD
ncbi:MAG: hypothetical protein J2P21_08960 [Chloracidobacterium sp.]|nr:hypothetical protein [Chloracidobacterium sp.]